MTQSTWNIDLAHSSITFSVRHMVVSKVRGRFARWQGELSLGSGDLTSASVRVAIDASSIDTGVADRDNHLRSADFLNTAEFPEITFVSRRAEKKGPASYVVIGDLSIAGVTREVSLSVQDGGRAKDPWGNEKALFSAEASLDRKDFGLKWNQVLEAGGLLVGERIEIEIELQATASRG